MMPWWSTIKMYLTYMLHKYIKYAHTQSLTVCNSHKHTCTQMCFHINSRGITPTHNTHVWLTCALSPSLVWRGIPEPLYINTCVGDAHTLSHTHTEPPRLHLFVVLFTKSLFWPLHFILFISSSVLNLCDTAAPVFTQVLFLSRREIHTLRWIKYT